jgi:hypothetical protein
LVAEALECGVHGHVDALARDALGAPVLVVVANAADPAFVGRAIDAADFLARVGRRMGTVVPEGEFSSGGGRVFAIGGSESVAHLELLARLPVAALWVGRLERFRLGGSERLVVDWLSRGGERALPEGVPVGAAEDLVVAPGQEPVWQSLRSSLLKIDPGLRVDGDRFLARITVLGRRLGEVECDEAGLVASAGDGQRHRIDSPHAIRHFVDLVLRRYLSADKARGGWHRRDAGADEVGPTSIRSALEAARLTAEEQAALEGIALPETETLARGVEFPTASSAPSKRTASPRSE